MKYIPYQAFIRLYLHYYSELEDKGCVPYQAFIRLYLHYYSELEDKGCVPYQAIIRLYLHYHSDETELEAAAATANDVTATIMAQRLELDSKTKTVEMLQKALNQQRELTMYHAKEMERDGQKRIELQKSEYEATIQRHQCFIDQVCV